MATLSNSVEAPFDIQTPALLVDQAKFAANIARLRQRVGAAAGSGSVRHRPHLKTVKSVELARAITRELGTAAITVSTLKEAEIFAAEGYRDILYAVGISSAKLPRVTELRRGGVDLAVITDNLATADAIAAHCSASGIAIPVLIEVDVDGHRAGVEPEDSARLLAIAKALDGVAELRGVMTHAGGSYGAQTPAELCRHAERERDGTVLAAETLRNGGYDCPVVSIGSTPTALSATDLTGVTELRAGVFTFFDLVMAGIGVCGIEDIALSVLTTVIGHQPDKGWALVDAGWMAMSRDLGTADQATDYAYGLVCDAEGVVHPDVVMRSANQEHGILALRKGAEGSLPDWPVGTQLRILPNHACATAAQHLHYNVINPADSSVRQIARFGGW